MNIITSGRFWISFATNIIPAHSTPIVSAIDNIMNGQTAMVIYIIINIVGVPILVTTIENMLFSLKI